MGVRQGGPLGLHLQLEEPTFGFPVALVPRHLVMPVPLAGREWLASFHATRARHLTPRRRLPPARHHATVAPALDESLRRSVELEALNGGLTIPLLRQAMAGVSGSAANRWVEPLNVACRKYEVTRSARRMAAFLGHIAQESGNLSHLEESLYYKDAHRVNAKFKAIKTDKEAEAYLRKPEALANKVYANRMGNGDTASGDGWRYRGRGLIQLTGKSNYQALAKDLKVDFVKNPDLVATPEYAAISAAWFWKKHGLNELADDQRYQALSLKINKKLDSFPEREAKRKRALDALSRGILVNLAMSLRMGGFGRWF